MTTTKTRKIQPNDVVIAAIRNCDRDGIVETTACTVEALEDLLCKIIAQFTPSQQLEMYVQTAGSNYTHEGHYGEPVYLTATDGAVAL